MDNFLIHIGLPKSGSTFLKTWFSAHPQLRHVSGGIAGFNNTRELIQFAVNESVNRPAYLVTSSELFSSAWNNAETFFETHEATSFSEKDLRQNQARVCALLHDLFPGAKVLLVTRGFGSSLRSGYSEYVKNGGALNFPDFLRKFELPILLWLDINTLVRLYETIFGMDKLLILPYELLCADSHRFFTVLEESLGIDHYEIELAPKNQSITGNEFYWYPRISNLVGSVARRLGSGTKFYGLYVRYFLRSQRLGRITRPLSVFHQSAQPDLRSSEEYLDAFRDKATILRNHPLYQDYAVEYLWSRQETAMAGTIVRK